MENKYFFGAILTKIKVAVHKKSLIFWDLPLPSTLLFGKHAISLNHAHVFLLIMLKMESIARAIFVTELVNNHKY